MGTHRCIQDKMCIYQQHEVLPQVLHTQIGNRSDYSSGSPEAFANVTHGTRAYVGKQHCGVAADAYDGVWAAPDFRNNTGLQQTPAPPLHACDRVKLHNLHFFYRMKILSVHIVCMVCVL